MSALRFRTIGAAFGTATLDAGLLLTGSAAAAPDHNDQLQPMYAFQAAVYSQNGTRDPRFTQLLGVNDKGVIVGYHADEDSENTPNKGSRLRR